MKEYYRITEFTKLNKAKELLQNDGYNNFCNKNSIN